MRATVFVLTTVMASAAFGATVVPGGPGEGRCLADTPEPRAEAKAHFVKGVDAFQRGDFSVAGAEFDAAYALLPQYDPLWNAANAWERFGELAKAANRYAEYLEIAPADAPDREHATSALRRLSPRLARVLVQRDTATDLAIDGVPANRPSMFVYPGLHIVTETRRGVPLRHDVVLAAGGTESVIFPDNVEPSVPRPPPTHLELPAPVARHAGTRPLGPWIVIAGAACTVVAAGITTWSGVDTLSARDSFVARTNAANYDTAVSDQTRTNVLLGVTGGFGLVTAVLAAFLVQWSEPGARTGLRVSPSFDSLSFAY